MKVLIVKTLFGKFDYYLTKFNSWTGIKDNAQIFTGGNLDEKVRLLNNRCRLDEVVTTQNVSHKFFIKKSLS